MKHINIFLGLCLVLLPACTNGKTESEKTSQQPAAASVESEEETGSVAVSENVLVTVNDESLTQEMAAQMMSEMAQRQGVPPQMMQSFMQQEGDRMQQQVVAQFIDHTLAEKEIEERSITVSDEEVNTVIETISGSLPEGMTLEQALETRGMNIGKLRSDIIMGEKMRKLFETETADVETVSDEQVAAFYNENPQFFTEDESVTARHILITCKEEADAEEHEKAKAEAEAIRKQLEEGADFAALAQEKSGCPSKEKGGDLGSFGRGRMVPAFDEAAFSLETGEISEVIKTPFGYHVIEVTDKTEAKVQPLEEASEQIREHLNNQMRQEEFGKFLQGLRQKAEINYAEGVAPVQ